jgi:hypothetical protein
LPTQEQLLSANAPADFRSAFPDLRFEVEIVIAEDQFGCAVDSSGTHLGAWGAIEPTGRSATFSGVNIFRFENGKVAEIWNHRDDLGSGWRTRRLMPRSANGALSPSKAHIAPRWSFASTPHPER